MARAKVYKSVAKRKTSRNCKTSRKCRISRKRTGAKDDEEVVEIPADLLPKKESKWKKAAKIALGLAAGSGAAALGYYGYKNRDKIKNELKEDKKKVKDYYNKSLAKGKEYYDKTKAKGASMYNSAKKGVGDFYNSTKNKGIGLYNSARKGMGDFYNSTKKGASDLYNNASKGISDLYNSASKGASSLYNSAKNEASSLYNNAREKIDEWYNGPKQQPYIPPYIAPRLTSGLEIDVVKELDRIRSDMKTTNRINSGDLANVLREYKRQILEMNPFIINEIRPITEDVLNEADDLQRTTDENSKEKHVKEIEIYIDTLISMFFKISRS